MERSSYEEIEDRTQRLEVKAIDDVRNGSQTTKIVSKRFFRDYQSMSRDREQYDDQMEMDAVYNTASSV